MLNASCGILLATLLSAATFLGVASGPGALRAPRGPVPADGQVEGVQGVSAQLRVLRMAPAGWEFELVVRNDGKLTVYVMTDPVRSEGSKGPYLSTDPLDPSVLDLGVRVYPRPPNCIYVNHAGVTLERLEPGASRLQRFTVPPPVEETMPPYLTDRFEPRPISTGNLKYARAFIGVLPDEEGVRDYLRRKEGIGPYARGDERLEAGSFKGKHIINLQTLVSSGKIELKP